MADLLALDQRVDRAAVLRPIIGQVLQLLRQSAQKEGGIKIAVGPHTIELSSWERAQLARAAAAPGAAPDWTSVLLDGVALQARGLNNLVRLAAVAPDNNDMRERCHKDLVFDVALGAAIHAEAERLVAAFAEAGRRGHAKNVAEFLQRFVQNLDVIKAALPESGVNTALTMSADLARRELATAGPDADAAGHEPAAGTDAEKTGRKTRGRRKGAITTKQMVVAAGVTVALVVGAMIGIPLLTQSYTIEGGLKYVPGIEAWSGVAPAIRVTVSEKHWSSLQGSERTAMVFAIAAAVSKDGYTSADVLTPDGKLVARWERATGVRRM